jgi:hypothetical protein
VTTALAGGLLVWGILLAILPVFTIPQELANLEPPIPPDKAAEQDLAILTANWQNAVLSLSLLGLFVGAGLAVAEAGKRGSAGSGLWRCPASGAIAAAFGAGAGLLGGFVFVSLQDNTLSPLARTVATQAAMLGLFGLGIGIAVAVPYGRLRLLFQSAVGGALGGLLTALLFPTAVGYLLPSAQTERILPKDNTVLLILIATVTLLIGLVLTGLGGKKKGPA